jgi:hypothetical protein
MSLITELRKTYIYFTMYLPFLQANYPLQFNDRLNPEGVGFMFNAKLEDIRQSIAQKKEMVTKEDCSPKDISTGQVLDIFVELFEALPHTTVTCNAWYAMTEYFSSNEYLSNHDWREDAWKDRFRGKC